MSAYYPPAQRPIPTTRPGTATAGAIIAIVMTALSLIGAVIGTIAVLSNRYAMAGLDFIGATGAVVAVMLISIAISALGLTAAILTLKNSNGWRITTVVFAFITAALSLFVVISAIADTNRCSSDYYYSSCSSDDGRTPAMIMFSFWSALALLSAILLLVNGANAFYANAAQQRAVGHGAGYAAGGYGQAYAQPAQAISSTPAGWYPVDGDQLRWWDGSAWTEHFHNPNG